MLPETKQDFAEKARLRARIILRLVLIPNRAAISTIAAGARGLGDWRLGANMWARMATQHGEKITKK